jgi:hypothetical protein
MPQRLPLTQLCACFDRISVASAGTLYVPSKSACARWYVECRCRVSLLLWTAHGWLYTHALPDIIDHQHKLLQSRVSKESSETHAGMQVYGDAGCAEDGRTEDEDMQVDVGFELERTRGGASLVLNDSLHRLLAHAVCLYHSVQVCSSALTSVHRAAVTSSCKERASAVSHECIPSRVLGRKSRKAMSEAVCAVTMRCLTKLSLTRQSFSRDCDHDGKKLIILWPHAHRPIAAQQTESLPQVQASGGEAPTASSGWRLTAPDTSLHELVGH